MNFKKYIPDNIKSNIKYLLSDGTIYNNICKRDEKKIIIALAANYGNLGDVAITYAQRKFLKENFKDYLILEIPIDETYTNMKSLKEVVNKNDIITIIGGGNFGNLYYSIEKCRQYFIKSFPKNKIVCFPQTIDFSNDKKGKRELKKAIKLYGKHENLTLFAREKKSYNLMKKQFIKNKVFLVPDIVLALNEKEPIEKREYITLCFRKDKEEKISNNKKQHMIEVLKDKYKENLIEQDTHIGNKKININEREKVLQKIWTSFKKSKIVLTDRLHGMIFCAITGTPCIAFPNSNGKIQSTYETWLKNVPYIEMTDENFEIEDIDKKINKLIEQNICYNIIDRKNEYEALIKSINE